MYPSTIRFETSQMEREAELGLYGESEHLAQRALESSRFHAGPALPGRAARLFTSVFGPTWDPKADELLRIPVFAALPRRRFELLVRTTEIVEVPAGTVLIREGETGRTFFAISEGGVEISSGCEATTGRAGDVFGEWALLYGVPRTATVKTTAPSRLFVLHQWAFQRVVAPSFA